MSKRNLKTTPVTPTEQKLADLIRVLLVEIGNGHPQSDALRRHVWASKDALYQTGLKHLPGMGFRSAEMGEHTRFIKERVAARMF